MKTAQVIAWGEAPKYVDVEPLPIPAEDSDTIQVKLIGAGLHRLVKYRADGRHYSATTLPHIPGTDGVGTTPSGKTVYFSTLATGGSFTEYVNVPKRDVTPLPEGLDPIQAAALVNPALASWMALRRRTSNLPKDFTALIMGCTGAAGAVAIPIARSVGAKKVIGVSREAGPLEAQDLDVKIVLDDKEPSNTDFSNVGDVDVILDFLWGPAMLHLLNSLQSKVPVQCVQIGSMSGWNMDFPASLLRSKDITFRGSGPGAWTLGMMGEELVPLLKGLTNVKPQPVKKVKLEDVESAWGDPREGGERLVFVP